MVSPERTLVDSFPLSLYFVVEGVADAVLPRGWGGDTFQNATTLVKGGLTDPGAQSQTAKGNPNFPIPSHLRASAVARRNHQRAIHGHIQHSTVRRHPLAQFRRDRSRQESAGQIQRNEGSKLAQLGWDGSG